MYIYTYIFLWFVLKSYVFTQIKYQKASYLQNTFDN